MQASSASPRNGSASSGAVPVAILPPWQLWPVARWLLTVETIFRQKRRKSNRRPVWTFWSHPHRRRGASKANPITYISKACSPMLLTHSMKTKIISPSQIDLLFQALQKRHIPSQHYLVEETAHVGIYWNKKKKFWTSSHPSSTHIWKIKEIKNSHTSSPIGPRNKAANSMAT